MESNYWQRFSHSRPTRRRFVAGIGGLGAGTAGLALVGCGDDDDDSDNGAPTSVPTPEPTPASIPRGGTLVPGGPFSASPPGLDPILTSDARTMHHASYVYSALIKDKIEPGLSAWTWHLEGDLASKWEQPDDLTTVFTIREDAKWQDKAPLNGRAVTAEDVVWALNAYLTAKESPTKAALAGVEKVEAQGNTVRLTHKEPNASFLGAVAARWIWMLPKEIGEADGNFLSRSVGSGPFIQDRYQDGVGATYVRNPGYYDRGRPFVDKVETNIVADASRLQAGMLSGDIDMWVGATEDSADPILCARKSVQKYNFPAGPYYLGFRSEKPPFNNPLVRQAVMLTLDYQGLVARFGGEAGSKEATFCREAQPWAMAEKDWGPGLKFHSKRDIAEAKKMLSAAGYPNGLDSVITLSEAYQTRIHGVLANAIAPMAQEAGIKLKYSTIPTAAYNGVLQGTDDWDGVIILGLVRFLDPNDLLRYLETGGSRSVAHINDPKLQEMIVSQRKILKTEERVQRIQEIDRYNLENNYLGPVLSETAFDLVQERVGGYSPRPTTHSGWVQGLWLKS